MTRRFPGLLCIAGPIPDRPMPLDGYHVPVMAREASCFCCRRVFICVRIAVCLRPDCGALGLLERGAQ